MSELFDKILFEVSWKIPTGIVDLTNPDHLKLIEQELYNFGVSKDEIKRGMSAIKETYLKQGINEYDEEIENLRIENPKTGRMVKISSVMTYKDSDPMLYKLGRQFVKDYMRKRKKNLVVKNQPQKIDKEIIKKDLFDRISKSKISNDAKKVAYGEIKKIFNILKSDLTDAQKSQLLSKMDIDVRPKHRQFLLNKLKPYGKNFEAILGADNYSVNYLVKTISKYLNTQESIEEQQLDEKGFRPDNNNNNNSY